MESIGIGCAQDGDCPGNLICYSANLTWNKVGHSFCDCVSWYGWKRESSGDVSCLGFSGATYTSMVWNALLLLGYFLLGVVLFRDLYMLLRIILIPKRKVNALFVSLAIFFLINVVALTYEVFAILTLSAPSQFTLLVGGVKWSWEAEIRRPLLSALFSLGILGNFQISLVWYEIAQRTFGSEPTKRENTIRSLIILLEFIFVAALVLDIVFFNFNYVWVICAPFFVLVVVGNCVALFRLEKAMSMSNSGSSQEGKKRGRTRTEFVLQNLKEAFFVTDSVSADESLDTRSSPAESFEKRKTRLIREMKRASFANSIALIFCFFLGLGAQLMQLIGFTKFCPAGAVLCLPTVLLDLVVGFILIGSFVMTRFLHLSTRASIQSVTNKNNGVGFENQRGPEPLADLPAPETDSRKQVTDENATPITEAEFSGGTSKTPFEPDYPSENNSNSHAIVQLREPDRPSAE